MKNKKGSKWINLIIRISTKQIKVDKKLYEEIDSYYLQRTTHLPKWAEDKLYKMLEEK